MLVQRDVTCGAPPAGSPCAVAGGRGKPGRAGGHEARDCTAHHYASSRTALGSPIVREARRAMRWSPS